MVSTVCSGRGLPVKPCFYLLWWVYSGHKIGHRFFLTAHHLISNALFARTPQTFLISKLSGKENFMRKINAQLLAETREQILMHRYSFSLEDERFSMERWVLTAANVPTNDNRIDHYTTARKLLRMTRKEADLLFLGCNWPSALQAKFHYEHTTLRQLRSNSRVAAEAIAWFLKEHCASSKHAGSKRKPAQRARLPRHRSEAFSISRPA